MDTEKVVIDTTTHTEMVQSLSEKLKACHMQKTGGLCGSVFFVCKGSKQEGSRNLA